MLEAVVNVSEGRRTDVIAGLRRACGPALLDVHTDRDHDRSVFTIVGATPAETELATRRLADAIVAAPFDGPDSDGVHPRLGILDVVPFVAIRDDDELAVDAARAFGAWLASNHEIPVFFYDAADPENRSLPDTRRDAFTERLPDAGPACAHPRLGASAVGARAPMIAVNCELDTADLDLARRIARQVRERDGGLAGVRALGFSLASVGHVQVSMNLVDLRATGLESACTQVRDLAAAAGRDVVRVEIVGLLPADELTRMRPAFSAWSGVTAERTIEAAMARAAAEDGSPGSRESSESADR